MIMELGEIELSDIKGLLEQRDPAFWARLESRTARATEFDDLLFLSALRRRAAARGFTRPDAWKHTVRLAILGGCNLYPLHELLTHFLEISDIRCELLLGDYDNYVNEIMDASGRLYDFRPEVVLLLPGLQRCKYPGSLADSREAAQAAVNAQVSEILGLCRMLHERSAAEVLLGNFLLPVRRDPGEFRARTLASDWSFRKAVNLELGLSAPPFVRICDIEFLANRSGALAAEDARGWFASKQPFAPALLADVSREAAHLVLQMRSPSKKVLVCDLDNTLWGGVVADDGLEGIDIGDTSPRGEAFKAFQRYILSLKDRGVLLAVCSKNDHARAMEPFEKHPDMVLRPGDFVSFQANWEPKSDNMRRIAAELNLGLDSFVFIDDNPAEIEIVRKFTPEVETILLGEDPAEYAGQLRDCRAFEPRRITVEDTQRSAQYHSEQVRGSLMASAADMDSYLAALEMEGIVAEFAPVDVPRLSQLINKSNQFNLTTRRRTEAEVTALIGDPDYGCFSVRLKDRFGDHGLISIVIGKVNGPALEIDTWLMSCRVLKRQVEELVLNELVRIARAKGCARLDGIYVRTAKNDMVRDHYPSMGFAARTVSPERGEFTLDVKSYVPRPTRIAVRQGL
jgi:FkbH-like protein